MKAAHLKQGEQAELACCHYLKKHGLKLVEKNFACPLGEIDLIMLEKKTLVFIEVRFRRNNAFGGAVESITVGKQHKIRHTAELYLQQNTKYKNARFDVVAMSPARQGSQFQQNGDYAFNWIQ
ncbi:MAG TPA: YraN family protein, partial [Thiotrichales bacterium]|nr:YraN family protein [Thiotrichales bacterium]